MKAAAFAIATIALQLTSAVTAAKETNPLRKRASQQQHKQSLPQRRRIQGAKTRQLQTSTATTAASSTPCSFCPDGLADPTLVLPVEDATTCLQAQEYAATLFEGDAICPTVKLAEELCCPPSIYDLGAANPDFSTLVSLVDAAGLSDALKGEGTFTLFGRYLISCVWNCTIIVAHLLTYAFLFAIVISPIRTF